MLITRKLYLNIILVLVISSTIVHVASFAPRTSVVVNGTRVELNCCINENDSATWTYISWNASTETSIYLGKDIVASMRSRYKIDKSISGQHNLIIDSVDLAHAGRYRCTGVQNQSLVNDIELTALGNYKLVITYYADLLALANDITRLL